MSGELEQAGDALMAAAKSLAYAWETESPDRVMWDEWKKIQPAIDAWMAARRAEPVPVDWPARFRAAGDVVEAAVRWPITAQHWDDIADRLESGLLPPDVVEAVERALRGEKP